MEIKNSEERGTTVSGTGHLTLGRGGLSSVQSLSCVQLFVRQTPYIVLGWLMVVLFLFLFLIILFFLSSFFLLLFFNIVSLKIQPLL